MKRIIHFRRKALATLVSTSLMAGAGTVLAATNLTKHPVTPEYDAGSVLVKFAENTKRADRKQLAKQFGASFKDKNNDGVDDRFRHIAKGRLAELALPKGADPVAVVARLKNNPQIEYAELNYKYYPSVIPNDPQYGDLWGMAMTKADLAWDMQIGDRAVVVGVIDTGFDYTHSDLSANIWTNPNEIANNGVDDDGNGYIDDIHGISAIDDDGNPMDTGQHGTHVSGTIGASGNNGTGVVGVNWQTRMVGCSFLGTDGGTLADGVQCINYMIDLKSRGENIRVLNNSWGGGGFTQTLKDAIAAANNADMLFVAAAGNDAHDNDTSSSYPASYDVPNVMAIASTTSTDEMSSFSQWGLTSVDMGAPGSGVLSTVPGESYAVFSGTSMATPHVVGAGALVLATAPDLTTAQLKDVLMNSGDQIAALDGKTVSGRRLNVENALQMVGGGGPTFYLSGSPLSSTVNQGEVATYSIDLAGLGGYTGSATLSATAFPALDAEINFSPAAVSAGGSTVMNVTPSTDTPPGAYTITVTAQDGELTKSIDVQLKVWPAGTVTFSYDNDQGQAIPDKSSIGASSTINVPDDIMVVATSVSVDVSHTKPSDLVVTLTSPGGRTATLHDREIGWSGTYDLSRFELDRALGDWTLTVTDEYGTNVGVLNGWSMDLSGAAGSGYNYLPSIKVNGPVHGSPFLVGDVIDFSASATDVEDGDVSTSITWSSDIDGPLGSGSAVSTGSLSHGNHVITVTAVDSAGQETSKDFNISVLAPNTSVTYSMDTPVVMPDSHTVLDYAIVSEIDVPEALIIESFSVSVDISFGWIGDLKVDLIAPSGKVFKLHDKTGYSNKNLVETFTPADFVGDNSFGVWKLRAEDMSSYTNNGVLNSWSISLGNGDVLTPPPGNTAPAVTISSPTGGSTVTEGDVVVFAAAADDVEDGDVSASINWLSSLDGLIGSGASVSTASLSAGEHTVMAEAVDSQGASGSSMVTLNVTPAPVNQAPVADFSHTVAGQVVDFSDMSGDSDGSVVAWAWDFGDGNSSSLANPSHTYADYGTYQVTLTVTDNDGATHSIAKSVDVVPAINLSASATSFKGRVNVDLNWSGSSAAGVDIYRDGVLINTTANDGYYKDSFRSDATDFIYEVCEEGRRVCSAEVSVQAAAEIKGKGGN